MKEITKYIADDGTEFDDEDECLEYERGIKIKEVYGFKVYDRQGKEIFPKDYVGDMNDFIHDVYYIKVENVKGWTEFEDLCIDEFETYFSDDGLDYISETGLYYKDEDYDCWMNWDSEYEKLRNIRKKMGY